MVQAKFQDHRTFGSEEKDFYSFLACHLGNVIVTISLPPLMLLHMKFGFNWS